MIEMRNRLIDLLQENSYLDVLNDEHWLLAAEQLLANGVIVPPCKVGDTLWVRWSLSEGHKKDIYPVKVYALRFDTKKNNMRVCVEGHFKITAYGGGYTHYYNGTFAWNSVGKTVFLTKEEAETALAERSGE
jgi:hypothetical protein